MAIAGFLNHYTYTQLFSYTHDTLEGTIHFGVLLTVTGNRSIIGSVSPLNTVTVTWIPTHAIDKWECRATKVGSSHGLGIGILLGNGNAVGANSTNNFDALYSQFNLGDGEYRISLYVQLDNIWYGG